MSCIWQKEGKPSYKQNKTKTNKKTTKQQQKTQQIIFY